MHASDVNPYAELVTSDGGLGRFRIENVAPVDGTDRMVVVSAGDPESGFLELQSFQALRLYQQLGRHLGLEQ